MEDIKMKKLLALVLVLILTFSLVLVSCNEIVENDADKDVINQTDKADDGKDTEKADNNVVNNTKTDKIRQKMADFLVKTQKSRKKVKKVQKSA